MSVADIVNWFESLPREAKLYWTGRDKLDYDHLPWRRYREYFDKASRSFLTYAEAKGFNDALSWDEYVKSPDYELWVFSMRDKLHRSYDIEDDRRQEEIAQGVARSPAMVNCE